MVYQSEVTVVKGDQRLMPNQVSIRAIITAYLEENDLTLSRFADQCGINRGIISKILNIDHDEIPSTKQLKQFTKALNLSEGALDDIYLMDFKGSKPDWRRTKAVIFDYAERYRYDLIKEIVQFTLDDHKVRPHLFAGAEEAFQNGDYNTAEILYDGVLAIERNKLSERLATSYYRLLSIHQNDVSQNLNYAIQFKPYRDKIPDVHKLQALIILTHIFIVREQWGEVDQFTDELQSLSHKLYNQEKFKDKNFQPARPLVYYYGQSYLLKGAMYESYGEYEKSLEMISAYEDLSWQEGLDENGMKEVDKLKYWANTNKLSISIKTGDQAAIPAYIKLLKQRPKEIVDGLSTLLESAIKFGFNVDTILEQFKVNMDSSNFDGSKEAKFTLMNEADFFRKYAMYLFELKRYNKGITQCLIAVEKSFRIKNKNVLLDSIVAFEKHRDHADEEQLSKYKLLIEEVYG